MARRSWRFIWVHGCQTAARLRAAMSEFVMRLGGSLARGEPVDLLGGRAGRLGGERLERVARHRESAPGEIAKGREQRADLDRRERIGMLAPIEGDAVDVHDDAQSLAEQRARSVAIVVVGQAL